MSRFNSNLNYYFFFNSVLRLFQDYFTHIDTRQSVGRAKTGPLIFLIYVNGMAGVIDEKILLHAPMSHKHIDVIELKLRTVLETISNWLVDKKLSLHLWKTESLYLARNENSLTVKYESFM